MDGVPLDAAYSFDLLRPGQPTGQSALPSSIRIFSESNLHWDMDASCRTASLTRVAGIDDPARIAEFVTAIQRDVTERDGEAISPTCRDESTLYHVFLRRSDGGGVGYVLLRPCRTPDGSLRGRMTMYNASGNVSVRPATAVMRMIPNLASR